MAQAHASCVRLPGETACNDYNQTEINESIEAWPGEEEAMKVLIIGNDSSSTLYERRTGQLRRRKSSINVESVTSSALEEYKTNPNALFGQALWSQFGVIDAKGKEKMRWDKGMMYLLMFLGIFTPFEVAFLTPKLDHYFYLNRLFDLLFLIDMVLSFLVNYHDPEENKVVYDSKKIVQRYLGGWFAVDLISILPFDILVIYKAEYKKLRVMRLIKLLRLGKASRLIKEDDGDVAEAAMDYNILNLIMFIVMIVLFSHWMACVWMLVATMEDSPKNWLHPNGEEGYEEDVYRDYFASLYFSVMTVTTIGYGDIVPVTTIERIFDIIAMLFGGLIFGYIIGAVGNVVQQRSAKENEYYTSMSSLATFTKELKIPLSLQTEIQRYFERLHNSLDEQTYLYYTDYLSPELKAKMLLYTNRAWIAKVPHFQNAPQEFIVSVACMLSRMLFPPQERIIKRDKGADCLYIINKGIAAGNNRLYTVAQIVGSESLSRLHLQPQFRYSVHAITYVECSRLQKTELYALLEKFPALKKRFRILALQYVFREELRAYCIAIRTIEHTRTVKYGTVPSFPLFQQEGQPQRGCRSKVVLSDPFRDKTYIPKDEAEREKSRVTDLFNKSERTGAYLHKLELYFPDTSQQRSRILRSVLKIQMLYRKHIKAKRRVLETSDDHRPLPAPSSDASTPKSDDAHRQASQPLFSLHQQLNSLLENQSKIIEHMSTLDREQRVLHQELQSTHMLMDGLRKARSKEPEWESDVRSRLQLQHQGRDRLKEEMEEESFIMEDSILEEGYSTEDQQSCDH